MKGLALPFEQVIPFVVTVRAGMTILADEIFLAVDTAVLAIHGLRLLVP